MNSFKSHLLAMASAIALMTGAAPAFAYSNKAYINQSGSYNTAYQYQGGGNGNVATTTQDGHFRRCESGSVWQFQQRKHRSI
jgi:hypothetical protein